VQVEREGAARVESDGEDRGASERRYRGLFTECPVSLWEEDISELVAHLGRLREAGVGELRPYFDAHPEEVVRCTGLIRIIAVNRATLELYEAPDQESLLAGLGAVFTEESFEAFRDIVIALAEGRRTFETEGVNRTLTGKRLHVGLRWSLLPDDGGALTRALISVQDLTTRRAAEERIRESEEFIRSILDTVDEGFIVVDRDWRILTANRAYADQAGLPADAVVGRRCHEVSHRLAQPCGEHGEECAVARTFQTGRPATALHRHPGADGAILYVETRSFPLRDAAGRVTAAIETLTNITEKHLLEEERLKSQKLESIGTLAGGIAHDFNNLLQGVFGYISMAEAAIDHKERALALLGQAEQALQMSVGLTSQLLTFSKGGRPVKRRLALGQVIQNAARFALSGSRSDCALTIAPDLRQVEADEGQIGQVIQNIVLNADQAMPLGGRVTIEARNLPAAEQGEAAAPERRDWVEIAVRDEGPGIPAEHLGKVFDPYFTTKEKGSGLGLATSYSIVRNHEGRLEVRSEVGTGTTFVIRLPAAPEAPGERARQRSSPATLGGRILLMDDDEMVRTVAGELLQALGHGVDFAAHGEEALAKFREARESGRPFDAVILDLTIRGGMGGAETLRRLLEIDPAVKAVVSSGYSDDAVTSTYRDHGFRAFLKKPYRLEELRETLDSLLG
jgi:PAS domain S-box-containing protein